MHAALLIYAKRYNNKSDELIILQKFTLLLLHKSEIFVISL